MITSPKPGIRPSISHDLKKLQMGDDDEVVEITSDEFDRFIIDNQLLIKHFGAYRDLDLIVFILSDRQIFGRALSEYPILLAATDEQLSSYEISPSGIHWREIDADISLRNLLIEESVKLAARKSMS